MTDIGIFHELSRSRNRACLRNRADLPTVPAGMALVAIDAVVNVPRNVGVREVGRIVTAVAAGALEDGVVSGIGVARCAHALGIAVRDRELRVLRVVKGCARPGGRIVAVLACVREELRLRGMTGIRRVLVVSLMAPVTGGG